MDASLLATKLRVPPQTHHTVRRTRLVDALERGIRDYKLVLLSTPAGFGKSTLLAQWARSSPIRVAWLSVGEEDNDPDRFFRSLVAAWAQAQPSIMDSPLGLLPGALEPDRDAVLAAFINVASDLPDHTAFVLDDAHLIEESSIHEALTFLLDHLPPTLHVILAGRAEPPLPLARYRARRQLLEFRTQDLQFHLEETTQFLNDLLRLDLGYDRIASLHAQMEGWIAGLQMVSLTLRRQREAEPPVVSGRHRIRDEDAGGRVRHLGHDYPLDRGDGEVGPEAADPGADEGQRQLRLRLAVLLPALGPRGGGGQGGGAGPVRDSAGATVPLGAFRNGALTTRRPGKSSDQGHFRSRAWSAQ